MSLNDEILVASSDSFWEIDGYKRTVKRAEDGMHMCNEIMKLISDRAEIETKYANRLKSWSKKWSETIDKGPEYGTHKATVLGFLTEAESMGEVHVRIQENLMKVHADVKKWKTDNYKKQIVTGCKEAKQYEDDFKKAQKPWAKKLTKVLKTKKDFHNACKTEKTLSTQASAPGQSEDQSRKLQERVEKCRKEMDQLEEKYREALKDLTSYKNIYIEDMKEVFEQTQDFENKRLGYFKDILIGLHGCLDLTQITDISEIYSRCRTTIDLSDASQDLKWWSQNHGVNMQMVWPDFEEYSSSDVTTTLTRKDRTKYVPVSNSSDDVPQTMMAQPPVTSVKNNTGAREPAPQQTQHPIMNRSIIQREADYNPLLNPFEDDLESSSPSPVGTPVTPARRHPIGGPPSSAEQNPFGDELTTYSEQVTSGVRVRALYDYNGQEEDELSFKSGDVFEKVGDRDDQGWCTGRKDGRTGLYPESYAKVAND